MDDVKLSIIEGQKPSLDEILAVDLAFHLGRREDYDYDIEGAVAAAKTIESPIFIAFRLRDGRILGSKRIPEQFAIEDRKLFCRDATGIPQSARVVETINRFVHYLDDDLFYAVDLWDFRDIDWAVAFGRAKPIPALQHHRRRGRKAPIIAVWNYYTFPSWNIPRVVDKTPFAKKAPRAVWRGAMTGHVVTSSRRATLRDVDQDKRLDEQQKRNLLKQSSRFKICCDHRDDPQVDAKFVLESSPLPESLRWTVLADLIDARMSRDDQLSSKYILALDGNDVASNMYWVFNTNSLVLRQASDWIAFAECYFTPWVHYVPLAADCSDLSDRIAWCESHQQECEQMVRNANAAWKVLFDIPFQRLREQRLFTALNDWTRASR